MKVRIQNIKNKGIVKEIDSNLLGDYLVTKEWEKAEEKKEVNKDIKPSLNTPNNLEK